VKGVNQLAGGAQSLQSGLGQLAGGIGQAATGATGLSTGASQLADGASQLADGATQLSTGVNQLATGSSSLAQGLDSAVSQIPTYSQQQADATAKVVANPVSADGIGTNLFGASAIRSWRCSRCGSGSRLVHRTSGRAADALSSRRPSVLLALRSLAPAAGIGAAQGLLVAGVAQIAANYDAGTWLPSPVSPSSRASLRGGQPGARRGLRGAGRWISTLVGCSRWRPASSRPSPASSPRSPQSCPPPPPTALLAAITPAGGLGAGLAGMIAWAALAFVATTIAVTRRRTANTRALLAAPPPWPDTPPSGPAKG
jgi:putative membrane protein